MSCPVTTNWKRGTNMGVEIDWTNTGTITYAFDVLFLVKYPGTTDYYLFAYNLDVNLPAGQTTTTKMTTATMPTNWPTGLTDGVALICDFDPATGQITMVYAYLECPNSINIT